MERKRGEGRGGEGERHSDLGWVIIVSLVMWIYCMYVNASQMWTVKVSIFAEGDNQRIIYTYFCLL